MGVNVFKGFQKFETDVLGFVSNKAEALSFKASPVT